MIDAAPSPPPRPRIGRAVALAAGLALLATCGVGLVALPRGPSEFAYAPDLFRPLPFAAMRGFTAEQLASHALRVVALGPALLLVWWGALPLLARRARVGRAAAETPAGAGWPPVRALRGLAGVRGAWLSAAAALLFCCGWWLWLDGRAITDDELTYRMQAALLAEGRLAEDRVPQWGPEAFTIWTARGATGKYLFGEPLVQAAGSLLGAPTLPHLPLAGLALLAWGAAVRRRAGGRIAGWAVALVAASPMFLFTVPTGLSHVTALAALAAAALGYELSRGDRPLAGALLLGSSLGFLFTVRPQVAVAGGVVLTAAAAWHLLRARRFAPVAALLAAGLLWAAAVAAYDAALTGAPLRLPWSLYHPVEGYGFGTPIEGSTYRHGLREAFENLAVSAVRFNAWWLGWPVSLALLALPGARAGRRLGPWPAVTAALIAVHLPYYSPGISDTGPVYYFELLLPASLAGAAAIVTALDRWGRRAGLLLLLCFALGTGSFLVEHGTRLARLVETLHAPAAAIVASVEPPALLLHESAPQEAIRLGWIFSFPLRERRLEAPLLTFPRGTPQQAAALRRRFPDRACWYYRVDPSRLEPQLLRCEEAEALLARPRPLPGRRLFVPSTARRLGLVAE